MKFFKLYVAFEAVCCCWFQNLVCAQQESSSVAWIILANIQLMLQRTSHPTKI